MTGGKNTGRGTLKGLKVVTNRVKSETQKLEIEFSGRLGGPIGPNERAFVDEVVTFTRQKAPLIGVRSWKDIKQHVKNSIVTDVMVRIMICVAKNIIPLISYEFTLFLWFPLQQNKWTFGNTKNPKKKILDIASERYRGWRSTFSSTYKAYSNYDERMKNKSVDLDIVEWHYLVLYFGTEQFQVR